MSGLTGACQAILRTLQEAYEEQIDVKKILDDYIKEQGYVRIDLSQYDFSWVKELENGRENKN